MRICCIVPGCTRTRGLRKGETELQSHWEWICGVHWPATSKRLRRVWFRAKRRTNRNPSEANLAAEDRLWRRMKRHAIERAMGIG